MLLTSVAAAQVAGVPVRVDSGPLSEISKGTSDGRSVHEPGSTLRELSPDRLSEGPVSGTTTGPVGGGSVSDASVGAVHDRVVPPEVMVDLIEQAATRIEEAPEPANDLAPTLDAISNIEPLPQDNTQEDPDLDAQELDTVGAAEDAPEPELTDQEPSPSELIPDPAQQ